MLGADNQGSFLNRFSIRRNQFSPSDSVHDQELEDLELLQRHVADGFSDLLSSLNYHDTSSTAAAAETPADAEDTSGHPPPPPPPPFLSIAWFRRLLDVFLCCEAEYKAILLSGRDPTQFSKPPLDRLIPDLLERSVKALDICNAINHGVDLIQHWQKLAQIAVAALRQAPLGDGQVRRARKALTTLLSSMAFDDKENTSSNFHVRWTERTRSFGRRVGITKDRAPANFRSLSWSVAKSWSAAKQIQTMSSNLAAPRGNEATGPAMPVYIMNTILVFVMWAIVAAIPCQERNGLSAHLQVPRNLGWAQPIIGLQEKIGDDWKKKEKKGTSGLLEELQRMEKLAHSLVEFADGFVFPAEEEKATEVEAMTAEMAEVCRRMEEGLGPLQQQVREVFHRIVRSRAEILEVVDQVSKMSTPVPY
ncbi:protein ROH1-like [Andrographis paniculata]|uniref:protein ROH1-like n=1 Tax=Andrographis paniculata TaxID=175694 RepID=UPI0021E87E2C|nr:protein ROH1-like [Andrographis paniculata]